MNRAIYPGSFNPWHDGHTDILKKAAKVFKDITIAVGVNPDKLNDDMSTRMTKLNQQIDELITTSPELKDVRIVVCYFTGLLVDFIGDKNTAVIRGLRNASDLEFETAQQYWNEDLGMTAPTVYFLSDRSLVHMSSSALRMLSKFKK